MPYLKFEAYICSYADEVISNYILIRIFDRYSMKLLSICFFIITSMLNYILIAPHILFTEAKVVAKIIRKTLFFSNNY